MLQQTRVNTVLGYYKDFLKKFPDIKSLALAKEQDILLVWAGLGYYRRAINLHKTAKAIIVEYDGIIPSEKNIKEITWNRRIYFFCDSEFCLWKGRINNRYKHRKIYK